ncbi:MAG: TonB-dependent receptor [Phenylobacterium sp.]|uniref:TonB-dependent receptor n=1 Tax=Phenylobacterium sp. TaxID=1871053 RepID=UPI00391C38E9
MYMHRYLRPALIGALFTSTAICTPALAQEDAAVDELVVTGQRLSLQRAMDTKREAVGVVDAISADDIGRLADKNVAENLERLPGVGLAYDQGEGRYVAIRGIGASLNNVTLNGVEVGNPDGDSRALPLDIVGGQLLGRIEVVKAVTPDMDAQGIGGTINLVTQSPFDAGKNRFAQLSLQGGYQEFNEKTPVQGDGAIGGVFADGRIGTLFGVNYSYRDYRSDGLYPDDWRSVPGVARGGLPTNIKATNYNLTRERIGASFALEFRPTNQDKYHLRGLYSRFTEDEYRQRNRLDFATNAVLSSGRLVLNADGATGVATGIQMRQDLRLEYKEKSITTFSAGGLNERGPWEASYDLSYGYNELVEPNQVWQFRSLVNYTVDVDMRPLLYTATPRGAKPSDLGFYQYTRQDEYGEETNVAARLDLKRAIDVGQDSYFKFGFKARQTDKSFDGRTDVWGRGSSANRFTLADYDLAGGVSEVDLGDHVYTNALTIDADAISAFTVANLNSSKFVLDTATTLSNATLNDYDLTERVYAGYAMAHVDFGQVKVTGGWRIERTETEVSGFRLTGGTVVTPVSTSGEYTDFLPNIQVRYEPREDIVMRAAYTRTLGRPQYPQLKPGGELEYEQVSAGVFEGSLSEGNIDLKPYISDNIDFSFEWYFAPGSMVSAGLFHKSIKDPIFGFAETRTNVTIEGRTYQTLRYSQPRNADKGEITGLELAYQQQFAFLPGFWSGFGVAGNVTFTDSELIVPDRGETPFPAQSDLLWGAQIFYQNDRLEAALSYHHTGKAIQGLGGDVEADTWDDDYRRLDAKISYRITDRIEVFADLQNLNDEVLREYQAGRDDWLTNYERYGRTYYLGVAARW